MMRGFGGKKSNLMNPVTQQTEEIVEPEISIEELDDLQAEERWRDSPEAGISAFGKQY